MISLCLGNLGMMLFRKNGLYIQMIMLLIFTAAALRWLPPYMKTRRKTDGSAGEPRIRIWFELAAVTLLSICLFCGAEAALVRAVDAEPGESAEALNIPLQQLARAYKSGGETMSEEDLELLYAYLPPEGLANYRPYITDGVKMYFNNDLYKKDPAGFWRIYLRLFRKYPGSYLIAPAYLTMGDWFLTDTSHTSVYKDWWRDRTGYLITDATPVFAERFVKKENLLPAVRNIYEALVTDCVYQRLCSTAFSACPNSVCSGIILFPDIVCRNSLCEAKALRPVGSVGGRGDLFSDGGRRSLCVGSICLSFYGVDAVPCFSGVEGSYMLLRTRRKIPGARCAADGREHLR